VDIARLMIEKELGWLVKDNQAGVEAAMVQPAEKHVAVRMLLNIVEAPKGPTAHAVEPGRAKMGKLKTGLRGAESTLIAEFSPQRRKLSLLPFRLARHLTPLARQWPWGRHG
jgi:hypothetical protein